MLNLSPRHCRRRRPRAGRFLSAAMLLAALVLGVAVLQPLRAAPPGNDASGAGKDVTAAGNKLKDAADSTTTPAPPATGGLTTEQKTAKLLDFLEVEYARKTTAPYWVSRAMGTVSLARSPRYSATLKLFDVLEKDKHEVVRLLAWQGLLARAEAFSSKDFVRFAAATTAMAEKDLFKGGLRAPALKVLACTGPTPRLKKVWEKMFAECNSWDPDDVVVLDALGECLGAWRSPNAVDGLIKLLTETDSCLRAEYVLRKAGCPVRTTISTLPAEIFDPLNQKRQHASWADLWQTTRKEVETWWKAERPKWKETVKPEGPVWKDLKGKYVAAPPSLDAIDPEDKTWYKDLELGAADLQQFEAVFMVDATGTMGDVLEWIKRDLGRMVTACQQLCKEPVAVGVTFYRDNDDPWVVKLLPLTTKLATIEPAVVAMQADGGGDIPEAILPALRDTITKNKWTKRTAAASKIIVLIGDAPPHGKDMPEITKLCKDLPERGMRLHAAKVKTELGRNDLSDFDDMAKAGGGQTCDVEFRRPVQVRYVMDSGRDIPYLTIPRPEVQLVVPGPADTDPPGDKILTMIVADAINPQYRDRVEPLAKTLLAFCARPNKPEKRLTFPANTPPLNKGMLKAQ